MAASVSSATTGVSACINLGFPFYTLEGPRGEPDDPLLETRTPLLFVIGEHAVQSRRDEIEDLRGRIKAGLFLHPVLICP